MCLSRSYILSKRINISSNCRAMRCISAAYVVMRCLFLCPCVRVPVTFVSCVKTNEDIFEMFSPSGSQAILVFFHTKRGGAIPTATPLMGRRMQGGYEKIDDFRPISRCISETVIVRWAHAARQFISIKFSFHPYNT